MRIHIVRSLTVGALVLPMLVLSTDRIGAQEHHRKAAASARLSAGITLTVRQRRSIEMYYAARSQKNVEALPPGIRKRLARGKPLPPGIAKRMAPRDLVARLEISDRYQLVEVGLDVLLVEAATGIVRDVLRDVIH